MNITAKTPLSQARLVLRQSKHAGENKMAANMLADFPLTLADRDEIVKIAQPSEMYNFRTSRDLGRVGEFVKEIRTANSKFVEIRAVARNFTTSQIARLPR